MALRRAGMGLVMGLALGARPALGQAWVVEAAAGGAVHDAVASSVGTRNAILGLRYQDTPWLYLSLGVPLDSEGLPWAAAGLGGRLSPSRDGVTFGLDWGAHAYGYRERVQDVTGGGATLEAYPFVALPLGPARLEMRSGVAHNTTSFAGQQSARTVHDSDARLAWSAGGLRLHADARYVRADDGDFPFVGAGAELVLARGELWGYAGRWIADAFEEPAWGVGGSLEVGAGVRLRAAVEQESRDPLYWNAARLSWSVGVSRALGGTPAAPPPLPVSPQEPSGQITLRIPLEVAASAPFVAGDFSGWEALPMRRDGNEWILTLPVEPGVYRYAFRGADGEWFVPDSIANRVDDGFGGVSAVLVVSAGR